ncbi:hypothetical protein ABFA07_021718 [Porites harrisoni]
MTFKKIVIIFVLVSICLAVPEREYKPMRKREDLGGCAPSVQAKMAKYGLEVSKLQCFSHSQARRSCCGAMCYWMAVELNVEPSTLVCPE